MLLRSLFRLLSIFLLVIFCSTLSLIYYFGVSFTNKGLEIERIHFKSYFSLENISVKYVEDFLVIDVGRACVFEDVVPFIVKYSQPSNMSVFFEIQNGEFVGKNNFQFSLKNPQKNIYLINAQEGLSFEINNDKITTKFSQVQLELLREFLSNFVDVSSFNYIRTGFLNGFIEWHLDEGRITNSDLTIHDFTAFDNDSEWIIKGAALHMDAEQKIKVKEGSLKIAEPSKGYDFGIEDLDGKLSLDTEEGIYFNLRGQLRQGKKNYPIFLEGAKKEGHVLEADASLLLDEGQNLKRYFHISISNPKEGLVTVKGHFDHVVESELNALRQIFEPNLVAFAPFAVDSMLMSFDVKGEFQDGHLVSISAEDIVGKIDARFYDSAPLGFTVNGRYESCGKIVGLIQQNSGAGLIELQITPEKTQFQAYGINDDLLNAVLTPFRDGWNLMGCADLQGRFENGQLMLQMESRDLRFVDEYVDFTMTQKPVKGVFKLDADQQIEGTILCESGCLKINGVTDAPLIFDQMHATIYLQNEDVFLEQITADFAGMELEGRLSIQPLSLGGKRLNVQVQHAEGFLHQLQPWIASVTNLFDCELSVGEKGFELRADLIENGDLDFAIDLILTHGKILSLPNTQLLCDGKVFYSTFEDKTTIDLNFGNEIIDVVKCNIDITDNFILLDPKKNSILNRPLDRLEGGKKEAKWGVSLDQKDLNALCTYLGITPLKKLESFEFFFGFRDFIDLVALHCKIDGQEFNCIKDKETLTLKGGNFEFFDGFINFFELKYDLLTKAIHVPAFDLKFGQSQVSGLIENSRLHIKDGSYEDRLFYTIEPIQLSWDKGCIKAQGGVIESKEKIKFFLSSSFIDLFKQECHVKSSKIECKVDFDGFSVNNFTGWIKGVLKPQGMLFELQATPTSFHLNDKDIVVKKLSAIYDGQKLKGSLEGKLQHLHINSDFSTNFCNLNRWNIQVNCDLGTAFLDAEVKEDCGLCLHRFEGDLVGLSWNFVPYQILYQPDKCSLIGSVYIDPHLIVSGLKTFKIDTGITHFFENTMVFVGKVNIDKHVLNNSSFEGDIFGKNLKYDKFIVRNFIASIFYHHQQIELKKVSAFDQAFGCQIESCKISLDTSDLLSEGIFLYDIKPSLIGQPANTKPQSVFTVKEVVIPTLFASFKDELQLKGKGELYFVNHEVKKKNLLDIPWDILSVLGLDLSLLSPVCGHLEFTFEKNKILLDRLKRSYSENYRSSFFLDPRSISYVGLDGSVCLRLRMKQSVLLRLAEPFVIAVDGNLSNPSIKLK